MNKSEIDIEEINRLFQADPSLENYLELRRISPFVDVVDITRFGTIDALLGLDEELRGLDVNPTLFGKALDGDETAIDELALEIIDAICKRTELIQAGGWHVQSINGGIKDGLITYLLSALIEICTNHQLPPPRSLAFLLRMHLCGNSPGRFESTKYTGQKVRAASIACSLKEKNRDVSLRKIAKIMEVEPSTVSRRFEPGEFEELIETLQEVRSSAKRLGKLSD